MKYCDDTIQAHYPLTLLCRNLKKKSVHTTRSMGVTHGFNTRKSEYEGHTSVHG